MLKGKIVGLDGPKEVVMIVRSKNLNHWLRREVCSTSMLVPAIVFSVVLLALSGCGGGSTPTGPSPTPTGTNSIAFVSADPAPGSTLKVGDRLNVTVSYTIAQASSFTVHPEGMGGAGTSVTVLSPGSGTATIAFIATMPGTSTVLDLNIGWGSGYSQSLTVKFPATWTWVPAS
jgi:hypothetical protein